MPKGLKLLNDFSGDLVNALHSRDIPANSLSVAENVQFSDSGSIKLIGEPYGELNLHSDLFLGGLKMIPFQEGHGIFHFKSDYCLSQKVRILAAFPNPDDGSEFTAPTSGIMRVARYDGIPSEKYVFIINCLNCISNRSWSSSSGFICS